MSLIEDDGPEDERPESKRIPFFVSLLVHAAVIALVVTAQVNAPSFDREKKPETAAVPEVSRRVRLQPPPDLRQLLGIPPKPVAPAPPQGKDRISIGPESDQRQKTPLVLERDIEIGKDKPGPGRAGKLEKDEGEAVPRPGAPGPVAPPQPLTVDGGEASGPVLPTGPRPTAPSGRELSGPSIRSALQTLDKRIGSGGGGIAKGGGQRMGPLFFDPEGADFTLWINHFRNEVYRNWIVPQPALLGIRGHVDIEFTVMRDGAVVDVKVVKGSGVPAFDRASANAIVASRLLALPSDFRPDRVTMTATFFYNEDPRNS